MVERTFSDIIYSTPAESKLSKSALRKAARQARIENKQQQRAEARKRRAEASQGSPTSSPSPPEESPLNSTPANLNLPSLEAKLEIPNIIPPEPIPQPEREEVIVEPRLEPLIEPSIPSPRQPQPENIPQYADGSLQQTAKETYSGAELVRGTKSHDNAVIDGTVSPLENAMSEAEKEKKRRNMLTRTIWTLIMIGGFIGERCAVSSWEIDLIGLYRAADLGPCLYDCSRFALSNTCLSGGYCSLFSCHRR